MGLRTYNVKLLATKEQLDFWHSLLAQATEAYNLCSKTVDEKQLPYSRVSIHNECYDTLRAAFPLLSSQQIIRVQCEVCSAYKTRRANRQHGETPRKHSLSITLDKRLYARLTMKSVFITSCERGKRQEYPLVLYPKVMDMFMNHTPKDPTVFLRDGSLYLSIPFEVQDKPCLGETSVGVDLGVKRLFVTSEGKSFTDKAYLRERRKARYLKRCLQSKGTKSAKRRLRKVSRREMNLSRDMVERSANALISSTDAGIFVLEDLKRLKQDTSRNDGGFRRKRHNSMLGQVPLYKFKERLAQKAALAGRQVQTVSPTWTSQTDSRNGKRDGERHGCRYYCRDGAVLDADWNAAVNIGLRANHPLSSCVPIDGMLKPLSGRVQSITQSPKS